MSLCRYPASLMVLSMASACVQLPEEPTTADLAHDAGDWLSLLLDAGTQRPDTGEPYQAPDCWPPEPASSVDLHLVNPDGGQLMDAGGDMGLQTQAALDGAASMRLAPIEPGDLVFTEIMANPAVLPDRDGEWFELSLVSGDLEPRNLQGCVLGDGAGEAHVIQDPLWLEPGDHAVFARGSMPGFTPDLVFSFSLRNSDDRLALSCQGTEIDAVSYGGDFPLASGASMALDPRHTSALENDSAEFWCLAEISFGGDMGSPGAANPTCPGLDSDAGITE